MTTMRSSARQAGITLIELLVVIVIGSVISGALLMTWFSLNDSYSFTTRSSEAQDFARDAVARMGRELRDAEGAGSSTPIISADAHQVTFTTTFNEEGNESRLVEPVQVQYLYEDGCLYRIREDGDRRLLVDHLLNDAGVFTYSYINAGGHPVSDSTPTVLGTISMMRIRLIVDLNPQSAPQPMDVSTSVHLRNQGLD